MMLLNSQRLESLPEENRKTALDSLPRILATIGNTKTLEAILWDGGFVRGKIRDLGVDALIADYSYLTDPQSIELRQALSLSAHILRNSPAQLPSQLLGRMKNTDWSASPALGLMASIRQSENSLYVEPRLPSIQHDGIERQVHMTERFANISIENRRQRFLGIGMSSNSAAVTEFDIESGVALRTLLLPFWIHRDESHPVLHLTVDDRILVVVERGHRTARESVRLATSQSIRAGQWFERYTEGPLSFSCLTAIDVSNWSILFQRTDVDNVALPESRSDIAITEKNGMIEVFSLQTGASIRSFPIANGKACITADGKTLISCSYEGHVYTYDIDTGQQCLVLRDYHYVEVVPIPNSSYFLAIAYANIADAIGVLKDRIIRNTSVALVVDSLLCGVIAKHRLASSRYGIALTDDGSKVAILDETGTLVWRKGVQDFAKMAAFEDSSYCLSGDTSDSLSRNGRLWEMRGVKLPIRLLKSRDVVMGNAYGVAEFWDIKTGRKRKTKIRTLGSRAYITGDERCIFTCSQKGDEKQGPLRIWGIDSLLEKPVNAEGHAPLSNHVGPITRIATSAGKRTWAFVGADHNVSVWGIASGQRLCILEGHDNVVLSVNWSMDERLLATSQGGRWKDFEMENASICVWNSSTGQRLAKVEKHRYSVTSASFVNHDRNLLTASGNGSLILWRMSSTSRTTLQFERELIAAGNTLSYHGYKVPGAMYSYLGAITFLFVAPDNETIVFGVESSECFRIRTLRFDGTQGMEVGQHRGLVTKFLAVPGTGFYVSYSQDDADHYCIKTWEWHSGKMRLVLSTDWEGRLEGVSLCEDGRAYMLRADKISAFRLLSHEVLGDQPRPSLWTTDLHLTMHNGATYLVYIRDDVLALSDLFEPATKTVMNFDANLTSLAVAGNQIAVGDELGRIHLLKFSDNATKSSL